MIGRNSEVYFRKVMMWAASMRCFDHHGRTSRFRTLEYEGNRSFG